MRRTIVPGLLLAALVAFAAPSAAITPREDDRDLWGEVLLSLAGFDETGDMHFLGEMEPIVAERVDTLAAMPTQACDGWRVASLVRWWLVQELVWAIRTGVTQHVTALATVVGWAGAKSELVCPDG